MPFGRACSGSHYFDNRFAHCIESNQGCRHIDILNIVRAFRQNECLDRRCIMATSQETDVKNFYDNLYFPMIFKNISKMKCNFKLFNCC